MQTARIAIVGAGLSGLYAAFLLEQQGLRDYVLLEAREVLGGRIASASQHLARGTATASNGMDRFDLGPTWFWPQFQPGLDRLIHDLGLQRFEQYEAGDMMVERSPNAAPIRMRGYANTPTSMRVVGGMSALIDALHRRLMTYCVRIAEHSWCACSARTLRRRFSTSSKIGRRILSRPPPPISTTTVTTLPPLPQPPHQVSGTSV